jgi:hypothetical protein
MSTLTIAVLASYLTGCLFTVPVMLFWAILGNARADQFIGCILYALAWPVTGPIEVVKFIRK